MVDQTVPRALDSLDLGLIRELEFDARQGYPALAKKLDSTSATVHRRLQRLLNERIIMVAAMPDPVALGYGTVAALAINATPGTVDSVADELSHYRNVNFVTLMTGRYDILAWAFFQGRGDLFDFMKDSLGNVQYLQDVEIMTVLKTIKGKYTYFQSERDFPQERTSEPPKLDKMSLDLIRELEHDGRQAITLLASKLGMTRSVTRRKLQALFEQNILRVVSVVDRRYLGYTLRASILTKVHPGRISDVANELASRERVQRVTVTTGRFNLIASVVFKDPEEMSDFLRNDLGRIPGVMRYETMINIKNQKFSLGLLTIKDHDESFLA